ncbi:peptidase M24, structural domain-containing protein [Globomyces pollinis-pini]|nr:peptidase M24, structural domain-containing protein [Globomyces pollinis-pini]
MNCVSRIQLRRWNSSVRQIGQPIHATHPHIIAENDGMLQSLIEKVTIGITSTEYAMRRQMVASMLELKDIAIIPGHGLRYATHGIFYPFHQQTDLFYLTGLNEPNACLTIQNNDKPSTLFVHPFDKNTERWDGPRSGLDGATTIFKVETAIPITQFEKHLQSLVNNGQINTIHTNLPLLEPIKHSPFQGTNISTVSASATHPVDAVEASDYLSQVRLTTDGKLSSWLFGKVKVNSLDSMIENFRLYKSSSEFKLMRKSGQIAGRSFVEAMKKTKPGMTEHQIHAELEYNCKMQGATGLSYVPVVAGGTNALILHYVQNQQILKDGDLVLVDAGAEYGGYASDITRTWPVNGKFSPAQRDIYQIVLDTQKEIIKKCAIDGKTSLNSLQYDTNELLREKLAELFKRPIRRRELNNVYPHHVGHYIGLDVHDTPTISRSKPLEAGMCITIEPGLYIPDEPEYGQYRGIGVRIEDDLYISENGPVVLSVEAPKEIIDIETIMSNPK